MACARRYAALLCLITATGLLRTPALASQTGLDAIVGIRSLIGSFFEKDTYVGPTQVDLFKIRSLRARIQLHGFSVQTVTGDGWLLGKPRESENDVIQEVWFVRDPHRFSVWAKTGRIPNRPVAAIARLRAYDPSLETNLRELAESSKRQEFLHEGVELVSLETRPLVLDGRACAGYSAVLIDRRSPGGFVEMPFRVTSRGAVCPHPDANWLLVDVGYTDRHLDGEPVPPARPELAAFVESVAFTRLARPVVAAMRVLDQRTSGLSSGRSRWIDGAVLVDDAIWLSRRSPDGGYVLTRLELTLTRLDDLPGHGQIFAGTARAIWLIQRQGLIGRFDTSSNALMTARSPECNPFGYGRGVFQPTELSGVWIACLPDTPSPPGKPGDRLLKRLDSQTGAVVTALAFQGNPLDIRASSSSLWVLEEPVQFPHPCRLHQINPAAHRVTGTIAPPKSTWCRLLSVSDDALWLARDSDGRHEMVKLDPASGTISTRFAPPEGLKIQDLVIENPTSGWVVVRVDDVDPRHGAVFGTSGGLLQVDLQAGRVVGALIPTGQANRLLGTAGRSIWLYADGVVARVDR